MTKQAVDSLTEDLSELSQDAQRLTTLTGGDSSAA